MRRSSKVTLVLLGVAALAGCSREDDRVRRDVYASRADCLADWGNQPEDCTPSQDSSQAAHGMFWGPYYVRPWYSGLGSWTGGHTSTHSVGSSGRGGSSSSPGVARGGFGSSSSAHGSGS
ncbi:MAG TPA: hypothetical protein VMG61_07680 [Usitatibacter sp.]|nr:hypothetical protein [Usitatibacter sp.]